MTDQTLQLLLKRLDHLTAEFQELRDGVLKAVRISNDDPEMALTRARKVLEYVVRDVFKLRCQEDPGTRPLENILQRLNKDGHLPKRLVAYASYIRDLGNVGTHVYGEELSQDDVRRSFENLTAILEWYFEQVRPDAFMKVEVPAPEDDPRARLEEEIRLRREELAQELAREEEKVRRLQQEATRVRNEATERQKVEADELKRRAEVEENARVRVNEPAPTASSGVSQDLNRVDQRPVKAQLNAPQTSRPAVLYVLGAVCLILAVLSFLLGAGGIKSIIFLIGLLLIVIQLARKRGLGKTPGAPARLPSLADEPAHSKGAPERRHSVLSGTSGKIIIGAICGFVGGAVAAPILDFNKPEPIVGALLVGVLHGLVIGFILIPFSKVLSGKIITSLVGIFIGMIVGVVIRALVANTFGNLYWYMVHSDGLAVEIMGGGILGFILGLVHGSKQSAR